MQNWLRKTNNRPISLLQVVAKIFEKAVFNQFYKFLSDIKSIGFQVTP